ncbi:PREDICTED: agamous-like MADS-box protein AGL53 [Camelina sativa]|uniref:Agamous-like MADS-box protein AGL53 n=1 Tax=Camelina sativa TaxID=90675 RepID=A0ABM1REH5_CAMSA|nr:PREDICTED: agamous-like MADS-box protein AGL53 [Camelina sativa]
MAERFSKLNDRERRKKSTNLSLFLNKKTLKEKKTSFDIKDNNFSEKVLEMEASLESALRQHQSKVSVILYNHDNGSFYQLPHSVSSFDPSMSTALLGAQGLCLRSNDSDLPMVFPPQIQTQTPPLVHFDQFAGWNQTPSSFADPMMFSYYS